MIYSNQMEQNQSNLQNLEQDTPSTPRNHDKVIIMLLLGIIIVLVVGILLLFFRNSNKVEKLESSYTSPTLAQPSITQSSTDNQRISNWKNYTDTIYGFSISLPKDWYIDKTRVDESEKFYFVSTFTGHNYDVEDRTLFSKLDGQVVDSSKNPIKIEVLITTNNHMTLDEIKHDWTQTIGKNIFGVLKGSVAEIRDLTIDGLPAIEIIYTTKSLYQIELVAKNKYKYHIGFYDFNNDFSMEDEQLLKQVITSFKILNN